MAASFTGTCLRLSALLQVSHSMLRSHCRAGDLVLDATMGNGHDTAFLAELVGEDGLVLAVDKQREALDKSGALLDSLALRGRVRLILADHKDMGAVLDAAPGLKERRRGLAAALFNLGYLPGGEDKTCVTDGRSTLSALDAVWPVLRPGGLLAVHAYTGHPGAGQERNMVGAWMAGLRWREAQVSACTQHNKPEHPETLYLALKQDARKADEC